MMQIRDTLLYAAFQEVDTRVQNLIAGDYELEARNQRGQDGMEFARHCNTLVASYNEMLQYFKKQVTYKMHVKAMEPVARTFRPL